MKSLTHRRPSLQSAGMNTLLGTATGSVRSKVTDSNGRTRIETLLISKAPGIGRDLLASGTAQH